MQGSFRIRPNSRSVMVRGSDFKQDVQPESPRPLRLVTSKERSARTNSHKRCQSLGERPIPIGNTFSARVRTDTVHDSPREVIERRFPLADAKQEFENSLHQLRELAKRMSPPEIMENQKRERNKPVRTKISVHVFDHRKKDGPKEKQQTMRDIEFWKKVNESLILSNGSPSIEEASRELQEVVECFFT